MKPDPGGPAPLVGRRVQLVPAYWEYGDWIEQLLADPQVRSTWRTRGRTFEPGQLFAMLARSDVLFVLVARTDGAPLGLVELYGVDERSQRGSMSLAFEEARWGSGWPVEGVVLFLHHCFATLGLRKVYVEVPGFNRERAASLTNHGFREEGVLCAHDYFDGTYHDRQVLAMHRDEWDGPEILRLIGVGR